LIILLNSDLRDILLCLSVFVFSELLFFLPNIPKSSLAHLGMLKPYQCLPFLTMYLTLFLFSRLANSSVGIPSTKSNDSIPPLKWLMTLLKLQTDFEPHSALSTCLRACIIIWFSKTYYSCYLYILPLFIYFIPLFLPSLSLACLPPLIYMQPVSVYFIFSKSKLGFSLTIYNTSKTLTNRYYNKILQQKKHDS